MPRPRHVAKRTIFRIWDIPGKAWWSPRWGNRVAADLFFRRCDAVRRVGEQKNSADLTVVECDLVPRDPFYRALIERAGVEE